MVEDHVDYPGILLKILGIVGIIFGLAFGLPGILLLMHGGSWFFAIAGLMTVIAGWLIFRGEGRGVALYCAVCIFAVGWSIWDVRALDSWFWPLIPRLFAFGVALFAVLLLAPLIPQWRHDRGVRNGFLIAAAVVGLGLAATVAMMFRPHGVIRHDFAAAPNTAVSQVARDMGGEWHNYGRTLTATRFTPKIRSTRIISISCRSPGPIRPAFTSKARIPIRTPRPMRMARCIPAPRPIRSTRWIR